MPSSATTNLAGFDHAISLPEHLMMLRRHWRIVLCTTSTIVLLTLIVLSFIKASYTATGILFYDPSSAFTPGDPLAPAVDEENEEAVTASQSAVIASLSTARLLAKKLNLAAVAEFNPLLHRAPWPLSFFKDVPKADPDGIAVAVRNAMNVSVLPQSRILAVSFTSADPALSAAAANLAMQIYLDDERQKSFLSLSDAQLWIEKNSAILQTGLDKTEANLAQARAAAGVVTGAQASLASETVSRVSASLVQAQADLAMNEARLSSAAEGDAGAANAAIAPNLLPLRKEQADLTARVQSLAGQYGANYPDLVAARASLSAVSNAINAETARELDAEHADVAADLAEISTLNNALTAARVQSQTQDTDSAPILALEQRADAGKAMLRDMTLQADELAQEALLAKPDARIISAALPPDSRNSPHRSLILFAATILGLCSGIILAALAEAIDTSFRNGGTLRAASGLACLALVPEAKTPTLLPLMEPFSIFSEQLRSLQTGLCLGAPHADHRVLAITAARPGEGKTTLTIALARALAMTGVRIVAVDCDVRQPSFDPVFQIGGAAGLTDHLAGLAGLDEIICRDAKSSLEIIGAGTQSGIALPLFLSSALPEFLEVLRDRYDVVLLDVPPAFALAEGRVLAQVADGALLCVRWGHTPQRVVTAAITLLRESGVELIGAVLTRVNPAAHRNSGFPDSEVYQARYNGYFR